MWSATHEEHAVSPACCIALAERRRPAVVTAFDEQQAGPPVAMLTDGKHAHAGTLRVPDVYDGPLADARSVVLQHCVSCPMQFFGKGDMVRVVIAAAWVVGEHTLAPWTK